MFKQLSRKHLLLIPVSIPIVSGCLYYSRHLLSNTIKTETITNDYIHLPNELCSRLFDNEFNNYDEMKETSNVNQDESINISIFKDLEALKLSQRCTLIESVHLALKGNVNDNSFRSPLNTNKLLVRIEDKSHLFELDELLIHLLKCTLSVGKQSECARYLTEQTLILFERNGIFSPDYDKLDNYHIKRYQGLYFQAILENLISSKENVIQLLDNGILILLHKLRELFPDKQVQNWISICISALSIYDETHSHLFHSGWIGILSQWLNSHDLRLNLEAAKVLHNIANKEKFHQSLYLLHPINSTTNSSPKIEFDLIFVHGLQGGVFKTWRQSDSMKNSSNYTDCWPKTWIPLDFDNCRILAVNYQTFLSNWNINCGHAHTLKERSDQLAQELRCANVGDRPIIWVTHSMGGLLVKEMLTDIENQGESKHTYKSLVEQTKGIVFFSVPHKGSEMAVWSPNMQRIISPSNQVLELRKDSPMLIDLHQRFLNLAERHNIECLSFGEGKHSTLIKNPVEFLEYKFMLGKF